MAVFLGIAIISEFTLYFLYHETHRVSHISDRIIHLPMSRNLSKEKRQTRLHATRTEVKEMRFIIINTRALGARPIAVHDKKNPPARILFFRPPLS